MRHSVRFIQSCAAVAFLIAICARTSAAQGGSTAPANPVQSAGANSGTYYIEDEILAYKSLQINSQSIADSLQTKLSGKTGVVIVPSVSTILPAFQLWRSNMLISSTYIQQADNILKSAYKVDKDGNPLKDKSGKPMIDENGKPLQSGPCPARQMNDKLSSPSFGEYATGVTTGVSVIQSILSLFTSNQSASGFQGTLQDQALMTAVSQEIETKNQTNFTVLLPDIFTSWNIDLGEESPDSKSFFFIGRLSQLVTGLSNLQDYYVCNQLMTAAGQQLTQDEQALDTDLTKLATTTLSAADYKTVTSDVPNQETQIQNLRQKIGILPGDPKVTAWKTLLDAAITALPAAPPTAGPPFSLDTLQKILSAESQVIGEEENPKVIKTTAASTKAQSVLAGISGYLSSLTGGAVTISTPVPSTSPGQAAAPAAPSTTAQTAQGAAPAQGASPQGGATPATPSPSSSTPSSPPPIVTILQADGLARKMKVDPSDWKFDANPWEVLWVKSLDSGSTTDMRSSIWGNSVRFAGGAVSGFALFQMDGTLLCSGNTAAYGGEIEPKEFLDAKKLKVAQMIFLNSGCSKRATDPAE